MNQIDMLGRKALAFGCSVAYEEPMSRHTTFKIGGPAEYCYSMLDYLL